ncbi:MAG: OmpA family protein [Candidatus Krumholzibacteriaceae bacterium]|jgi:outer membrane protein OmpA-like peptidoglycan-associated protein
MRNLASFLVVVALCVSLMLVSSPAKAQFGDLKNKLKDAAKQKAAEKVDKTLNKAPGDTTKAAATSTPAQPAGAAKGGTAAAEDMTLYTKYDFVPGDKVIFYDDLANEEIGEFPSRWKLDNGVFEVAKQGNENYIMCTDKGYIRPKVATGPLPPKYTVEMEFYSNGPGHRGNWFYIQWMDASDSQIGQLMIEDDRTTSLKINDKDLADKDLPALLSTGKHTMRIMATKSSLKCYIDNERVANVPAIDGFAPVGFRVQMDPWTGEQANPMLMRSFRFAEGGKTLKEQLDETGRIVTHGILFDSGSDKIRAESYKTLADIGQLLTGTPALRLSIEGHTDSDGAADYNLTLSDNRAKSVKSYLMATYKIDGARLESKGWGETKPIDKNDTAEGKANNRRVELIKL